MASYGDYNGKIVIDENKENLDSKNTKSTSAVKRAVVGNYTSSEMRKGPYLGYIIKKYDVISEDEEEGFFSFLGFGKSTITVYKVRIPELDAHIPEPDIENPQILTDKQYIDMHPTYHLSQDLDVELEIGDKVWVERDDVDVEKNIIIKSLEGEKYVEGGGGSSSDSDGSGGSGGAKSGWKSGSGEKAPKLPKVGDKFAEETLDIPSDLTELEKWNSYSRNSGNPLNIDIVTKKVNGQNITLSRKVMPLYEQFVALWDERRKEIVAAGHNDPGIIQYKFGEAFRIWGGFYKDKDPRRNPFGGGQFRDSSAKWDPSKHHISKQRGTHTAGNAIDIAIPKRYWGNKKAGSNYHNLVVHCAQHLGFIRFGIGMFSTIHMDIGLRANGTQEGKWSWVYDGGLQKMEPECFNTAQGRKCDDSALGYYRKRKMRHYKNGFISEEWVKTRWGPYPPDLRNWDYLKGPY